MKELIILLSFFTVFTLDGAVNHKLVDCAYTVTVLSYLELGVKLLWGKRNQNKCKYVFIFRPVRVNARAQMQAIEQ